MTAPREPHRPPSPPDRLPSPRGGHPSPSTESAAARPAGFARLAGARRGLVHSVRALAAAALLALSGGLALPATAQAQDTDPPTLISASVGRSGGTTTLRFSEDLPLTVGEVLSAAAQGAFSRTVNGVAQNIADIRRDFLTAYSLVVYHKTIYSGQAVVVSYDQSAAGTDAIADAAGNEVVDFTTGSGGVPAVVNNSTQVAPPGTLSALVVNDGNVDLTLTPTFVSGTTTYTAMVASTVAEVTVTAMTTNSGESLEYLDGDDATLDDAGTAAGHQVAVAEGDNVIKVKVTAADGNTTQTYTVTVTRAAATDTTAPTLTSASVARSGSSTTLWFSEDLDLPSGTTLSATAQGAFSLTTDSGQQNIREILRGFGATGARSLIVHHSKIYSGETVVVSYDQSAAGADAIDDAAGNEVVDFTTGSGGVPAVTNSSAQVAPATDATLSALTVTGGGKYLVAFVSGTETYTASVANTVAEVTVTAMTTNSGATIEYLDGDDATLADAGTAAGHQVAVAEGANVIKVKVMAVDGNTTQTYTVTVTRAAQDTPSPYDPNAGITMIDTNGDPLTGDPIRLTIREGFRGRYGFKLNTRPTSAVWVAGIQSDGDPDVLVLPTNEGAKAILADEWETPFYMKIRAALDDDAKNGERYFLNVVHSRDRNYHGLILPDVIVVEDDRDDDAGALSVADAEATEGVDNTLDFVVKLDRRPSLGLGWEVTVDYRTTQDGRAIAGSDYTSTSGTLTFAPGEDEKTVSVPIMDDAVEDDGETFTLVLSNAINAGFARNGTQAVGTIRNTEPLTATFPESVYASAQHTGPSDRPQVVVAFSAPVAAFGADTPSVSATGASVDGVQRLDKEGLENAYVFFLTPEGQQAIVFRVHANRACPDGGICTADRRRLSNSPSATIPGPSDDAPEPNTAAAGAPTISGTAQVGEALSASTSGISDADGLDDARFGYQWIRASADIDGATGGTYTPVDADEGERLKVRVSFTDDAGHEERLTSAATDAVAAASEPLTASFEGMPAEHAGQGSFSFRVAFSEGISVSYTTVRDASFQVTAGEVTAARRVDGRRDLWEITVKPASDETVTVRLPETTDCGASGAICTGDGRPLSHSLSATVAGPAGRPERNTAATGTPAIGGTPQVGEELTASTSGISDADGLDDASFGYQWIRTDTDIGGATGGTYTPVPADEGERLKVRVSFTDDAGHEERLTSAATDAVAAASEPLTASFEGMPAEHAGQGSFSFRVAFSEGISISYRTLRDASFTVTGGDVTQANRVGGRRDLWRITIKPDSDEAVSVRLPETTDCAASGAICTGDGRPLSHALSATVSGPVGISVADARVEEGAGAVLAFAVTLSRAASAAVTVDYATADGSAQAGDDYRAASGTLKFAAGESSKTIEVGVLDDAHDEGEETLTLRLSNASEGQLADDEATGTIENTDPLPRALLARFGRATALQVMEQVEERLEASRDPGLRGRFAGRELRRGMEREMGRNFLTRLQSTAVQGARDTTGVQSDLSGAEFLRTGLPGGGDLLMGSGFVLNRETGEGGSVSLWSRGMESRFSGRDGELSLDGGVRTTMFGADYAQGPLIAGLMLSHRRGLGGYQGADVGQVASSVTGLHPWVGYKLTERVTLWGVTGYGRGSMSLTPGEALSLPTPSLTSPFSLKGGLSMSMLAGGVRGDLVDAGVGGFGLAFKADALWVGTGSEAVDGPAGRLAGTEAVVTRVRTALEASRGYVFGHGIALRPSLELGLRSDGGDAETGAGADVAGSLLASDPSTGLSVDVRVRTLLVHQDRGFREQGVSVSFSYDPTPSTPLGFTARLAPSWGGQAMSGTDALWGRDAMTGLGEAGPGSGHRLDGELGYALPVGRRLVGTPRFGVTTSEYGRDYRLGYSLGMLQGGAMKFQFGLDAQRRESLLGQGNPDHSLMGRLTVGW